MCIFENSLKQLVWMFSYWILKGKRIIWVPAKESGGREGGQEERETCAGAWSPVAACHQAVTISHTRGWRNPENKERRHGV